MGDGWAAHPIVRRIDLRVTKGSTVSLLPFGKCSGITLDGLHYPLTDATLQIGEIAVSNVATRENISIKVKRGKLMAVVLEQSGEKTPGRSPRRSKRI
jgi:thiamine pyrophosphokinase